MLLEAEGPRFLVDVNAALNLTATVLIVSALVAIKRGNEALHKKLMLSAVLVSALFLVSYLIYHFNCDARKFGREGTTVRSVYLFILLTHVVLAVVNVPLVIMTVLHGVKEHREKHRRWAKITAPVWLYVSITGVIVYYMLYQM